MMKNIQEENPEDRFSFISTDPNNIIKHDIHG